MEPLSASGLIRTLCRDPEHLTLLAMDRSPLDSSTITAAAYDDAAQLLEIEFRTGRVYQFEGVPRGVYDWLVRTPSKGAYFARMINNRYPFREVSERENPDEPDLTQLLTDSVRWLRDKQ